MIHGMDIKGSGSNAGLISAVLSAGNGEFNQAINHAAEGNAAARETMINGIVDTMKWINSLPASRKETAREEAVAALYKNYGIAPATTGEALDKISKMSNSGMTINGDTAVFMQNEDWGSDQDVPVTYASYIFKKPQQWEFHAYGMTANGPVGKICRAYGFAGAYYVTPMWHVQGEFVKNLRKLPLNEERPYSFNYGLHYGTADVLKARSFEVGLDYVYSQAGSYFGGSSDDIVDQYMGHVYKDWHGMKNVPAYIADVMDDTAKYGGKVDGKNYGGAKFFLAKASFVPMRGLIIDAEYGFNAKDMGGRKMDNMFMLKATAYLK